jgi:hypothetical protein
MGEVIDENRRINKSNLHMPILPWVCSRFFLPDSAIAIPAPVCQPFQL